MSKEYMRPEYPHFINADGTIDSICPRCYATIGTCKQEIDLVRLEIEHHCEISQLQYFESLKKKPPGSISKADKRDPKLRDRRAA